MTAIEFEEWIAWYTAASSKYTWKDWSRLPEKDKQMIRNTAYYSGLKLSENH